MKYFFLLAFGAMLCNVALVNLAMHFWGTGHGLLYACVPCLLVAIGAGWLASRMVRV